MFYLQPEILARIAHHRSRGEYAFEYSEVPIGESFVGDFYVRSMPREDWPSCCHFHAQVVWENHTLDAGRKS